MSNYLSFIHNLILSLSIPWAAKKHSTFQQFHDVKSKCKVWTDIK